VPLNSALRIYSVVGRAERFVKLQIPIVFIGVVLCIVNDRALLLGRLSQVGFLHCMHLVGTRTSSDVRLLALLHFTHILRGTKRNNSLLSCNAFTPWFEDNAGDQISKLDIVTIAYYLVRLHHMSSEFVKC